ncbi:putative Holliday junction resolvase [Allocatelliglobosispora scoriae]|uniref:Putative pre-16S rRNA nuclease n=1 Tax=Allocatelliglobosispora scoriae TaxID=643052 RepID=A0A841BY88_9ACTN|nr:Holliday junction resolvase RuvX [Allocatelliglobosispora scoriae]MBB5873124.1 putative Holliday junction resolvase [Allocatelliglobosispora scoriae]
MIRGVRLGIDVGTVRIGVARCDPDGILATPVVTVAREREVEHDPRKPRAAEPATPENAQSGRKIPSDMAEIARIAAEHGTVEIVVGLPVNLAGMEGPAAKSVREYALILADVVSPIPIVLADERMSTVAASRRLSDRGLKGKRKRAVVDQAAAVEILQSYLDGQRRRD